MESSSKRKEQHKIKIEAEEEPNNKVLHWENKVAEQAKLMKLIIKFSDDARRDPRL